MYLLVVDLQAVSISVSETGQEASEVSCPCQQQTSPQSEAWR